jgi:hypothetical protein
MGTFLCRESVVVLNLQTKKLLATSLLRVEEYVTLRHGHNRCTFVLCTPPYRAIVYFAVLMAHWCFLGRVRRVEEYVTLRHVHNRCTFVLCTLPYRAIVYAASLMAH